MHIFKKKKSIRNENVNIPTVSEKSRTVVFITVIQLDSIHVYVFVLVNYNPSY